MFCNGLKTWNRELIGFDLESGKNLFQIPIEDQDSQYRHSIQSSRIYGDLIYIQGFFTSPRRGTSHKQGDRLGLFQLVLDKKGNEVKRVYRKWEEMKTDFTISPEGEFDSKYQLYCSGSFTFSNGAAIFLLSPRKLKTNVANGLYYNYEDFICMSLDSNFELQTSQLIQRKKEQGNSDPNFMYAQYINDNQGLAFFLRKMDKKKTLNEEGKRLKLKNWTIQIGTITDGQFKMDEITKETKYKERGSLSILPAKEGHLILWDESKDESEIRLERLNL